MYTKVERKCFISFMPVVVCDLQQARNMNFISFFTCKKIEKKFFAKKIFAKKIEKFFAKKFEKKFFESAMRIVWFSSKFFHPMY